MIVSVTSFEVTPLLTSKTVQHIFFDCPFSLSFWNDVIYNIYVQKTKQLQMSLAAKYIIIVFLREEMDLVNYIFIRDKIYMSYIWDFRRKDIKPAILHFKQLLVNKYGIEKLVERSRTNIKLPLRSGISTKRIFLTFIIIKSLFLISIFFCNSV